MTPQGPTLVIADGDLTGLLACAATSEAARGQARPSPSPGPAPAVWIPYLAADGLRIHAARAQAETYDLRVIDAAPPGHALSEAGTVSGTNRVLLEAAATAAAQGLECVLWPIHAGEELDLGRIAAALDRADLVSRLAGLDAASAGLNAVQVRAPYADFTDAQIGELALDMDLPVRTCWWWDGRDDAARRERERWGRALARAGWNPPQDWGLPPAVSVAPGATRAPTLGRSA